MNHAPTTSPPPPSHPPKAPLQGLDWVMLRLLPILGGFGALIPIAGLLLVRLLVDASASPAAAQQVEMLDFRVMVVTVIYWSVFVTLALGFTVAWALRRGKSVLFAPPRKG